MCVSEATQHEWKVVSNIVPGDTTVKPYFHLDSSNISTSFVFFF